MKRRLKIFIIAPEALALLFQDGRTISLDVERGIPTDGKIVDRGYIEKYGNFYITIEHHSFPELSEGCQIPISDPILLTHPKSDE